MKRILVTGADGFSASHLLALLRQAENIRIEGTVLNDNPHGALLDRIFRGDISEPGYLSEVVLDSRPDHIYHLAAVVPISQVRSDFPRALRTNVEGTYRLLEAVSNGAPKARMLVVGSSDEYGTISPEQIPLCELDTFSPANEYGVTKVAQELLGRLYQRERNIHVLFTRTFNITGPGQPADFVCSSFAMQVAKCIRCGGGSIRVGNLDVRRDILDVRDAVAAYRTIMEEGSPGTVYNVCSGEAVSLNWILEALLELAGVPIAVERDEGRVRKVDIPYLVGSNNRIRGLGWRRAIPMRDTLQDLLTYWEANLPEDIRCNRPVSRQ
jgi:GDP-4-dehydro-6-deoxy-D-mannose reductase